MVESGEYEERSIDFVASSVEAAVAHLKKRHVAYEVIWSEPKQNVGYLPGWVVFEVTGSFAYSPNHSTKHETEYSISEYEVQ